MNFNIPAELKKELNNFDKFLSTEVVSNIPAWNRERAIPRLFFSACGNGGMVWLHVGKRTHGQTQRLEGNTNNGATIKGVAGSGRCGTYRVGFGADGPQ